MNGRAKAVNNEVLRLWGPTDGGARAESSLPDIVLPALAWRRDQGLFVWIDQGPAHVEITDYH